MATIQKRGDSFRITVSNGYNTSGGQMRKTMTWKPSKGMTERQIEKEVERQAVIFEEKVKSGQVLNSSMKFEDFADKWLKDYGEKQLAPKTLKSYKDTLVRINAAIGHIRLDRLQPHHIIEFYNQLEKEGVKDDTTYQASTDIKKLLKYRHIKQINFSKTSGLSTATIRLVCSGKTVAPLSADKVSKALDMKRDTLFKAIKGNGKLAANSVLYHHRVLSSILSTAVQWQLIVSNPCERVKPPKAERQEALYLDEVQAAELMNLLQNEPYQYQMAIILLINSGLRRGELCGLKWADLDFEHCLISISRSLQYLPKKGLFEKDPKNNSSVRTFKIPKATFDELKAYRSWQTEQRLKMGDNWIDGDYLFTQWNGKPMHPDTLTKWFEDFIKKTDLPQIHIHSLRHTNATLLIANHVDIRTIAGRLGHAQLSTTENIYAHAIKSADEAAADTLQDILSPGHRKV